MEMHQLRYFAAVARLGGFSRAAVECHVAQPSLSQQIRKLEEEVGEPLFERKRRRSRLTSAGKLLLPHALAILEAAERGRTEIREMDSQVRGRVVLGALPTVAPYFLPEIIAAFQKQHPAVELEVREETTAQLLRGLEDGELDLALLSEAEAGPHIEMETLFSEELLLCLPLRHPFARRRLSADDLRQERFILMQDDHCLGTQARQFCQSQGFRPRIACRSAQIATVQAMVRAGLGISLVPRMAREGTPDQGLLYRSLDDPRPHRIVAAARPRKARKGLAAVEFLRFVRAGAERLRSTG
jgi:LysR family hydrogen peroxide-inducible transcriptional activator